MAAQARGGAGGWRTLGGENVVGEGARRVSARARVWQKGGRDPFRYRGQPTPACGINRARQPWRERRATASGAGARQARARMPSATLGGVHFFLVAPPLRCGRVRIRRRGTPAAHPTPAPTIAHVHAPHAHLTGGVAWSSMGQRCVLRAAKKKKKRRTRGARRGGRGTRCLKNRKARTRAGWLTGAPRTAPRTRAGGGRGRWAGGYSVTGWRACGGGVREHVMGAGAVGKRSEQRRWRRVEPAHSLEKSRRVQLPARAPPAPPHAGAHQRAAGPWWRRRHHRPPPPPPPSPHQAHPLRRPPRPRAGRERGPALLAVRWADGRRCVCGGEGRIRGAWCGKMGGQAWAHARALGWTPRWGAGRARSPGGRGEKKASTHTHARPRAMQRSPTLALSPLSPPQAPTGSPPSAPSSSSPRPAPSSSP